MLLTIGLGLDNESLLDGNHCSTVPKNLSRGKMLVRIGNRGRRLSNHGQIDRVQLSGVSQECSSLRRFKIEFSSGTREA